MQVVCLSKKIILDHFALFLLRQFPKYLPKIPTQRPVYRFLAPLRNKHHVMFAIPFRMIQTLVSPLAKLGDYLIIFPNHENL